MTDNQRIRATLLGYATGLGVAACIALTQAGMVGAQPLPPPVPGPDGAPPAPGQPVFTPLDPAVAAAPPPLPVGPPMVPQIDNPQYGSGDGPLGFLRDAWHQAKDPFNLAGQATAPVPAGAPPPGAGAPPPLPPGYTSMNAPGSETLAPPKDYSGGPELPPGYHSLDGPLPPGYEWGVPPPPPPPDPNAYVPVVSPPPPPLFPQP